MSPVIAECLRLADEQLASSQREMGDVRSILEDAIARLIRDRSSATALQFQDISDQLLVHASMRLQRLRLEMGHVRESLGELAYTPTYGADRLHANLVRLSRDEERPVRNADLTPGPIDLF